MNKQTITPKKYNKILDQLNTDTTKKDKQRQKLSKQDIENLFDTMIIHPNGKAELIKVFKPVKNKIEELIIIGKTKGYEITTLQFPENNQIWISNNKHVLIKLTINTNEQKLTNYIRIFNEKTEGSYAAQNQKTQLYILQLAIEML